MNEPPAEERVSKPRPRKRRSRLGARGRRILLGVLVAALLGGNVWMVRRQYPSDERRKNRAYDRGLDALTSGDYPTAELHFVEYLQLDPTRTNVQYLLGMALGQQGKIEEARAAYEQVLALQPEHDEARVVLAELALDRQDYAGALRLVAEARAEPPTPAEVHIMEGRVRVQIGDRAGAVQAYRRAVLEDPDSYESYLALGDLLMAASILTGTFEERQSSAQMYSEAEKVCLLRLGTGDNRALRLSLAKAIAGQARVLQERSLDEAVEQLRIVANADPDDPEPQLLLAEFFRRMGELEEAQRQLRAALRRWPTVDMYVALHELHIDRKDGAEALAALEEGMERHPKEAALRIRLIGYLVQTGNLERAATEADNAGALLGGDFRIHEARGDLAAARGRRAAGGLDDPEKLKSLRAEAIRHYRSALDLKPRSLRLRKKAAGELIETLLAQEEDAPRAVSEEDEAFARRCIADVLEINPRDTEALAWTARLELVEGNFEEVAKRLRAALDAPDPSLDSLRLLGIASERLGDYLTASDAYGRVVDLLSRRTRADEDHRLQAAPPPDWAAAIRSSIRARKLDLAMRVGYDAVKAWPEDADLVRLLARALLGLGEAKGALTVLEPARRKLPADGGIRLLLARAYEMDGRTEVAEEELRTAVTEIGGDGVRDAYYQFLARTGRDDVAEQGFLELLRSRPKDPAVRLRLGDFYLQLRPPRPGAARKQYTKALELAPEGSAPLLRLAELELHLAGRNVEQYPAAEAAVRRYEEAAASEPYVAYLRGKLDLVGGRTDAAVANLEAFLEKLPNDPPGLFYYGRALRVAGRLADARAPLERAAVLKPDDEAVKYEVATLRYELGIQAFQRGDNDAARALFEGAHAGGARAGARLLAAGAHLNAGNLGLSENSCREFLKDEPDNGAALHLLAALLLRSPDTEKANESGDLYRRLLEIDPADLLAKVGLGTVYFRLELYGDAERIFREAYPASKGDPGLAMGIAQCIHAGGSAASALEFLQSECEARPDSAALQHIQGDFLAANDQWDAAAKCFIRAYDMDPNDDVALLAGAAAMVAGHDYERARKMLVERIPKAEKPALLHLALGDVLTKMKRFDDAGDALRKGLALAPGHPRGLVLLGALAEKKDEREEARRYYREAVNRGSLEAEPRIRLAVFSAEAGDRGGAIEMYSSALRFAPADVRVLNNLAELLGADSDQLELALEHAGDAASLAPNDPAVQETFGWLLFRTGKIEQGARVLHAAADALELNATAHYHAGVACERAGRERDARIHLERCLRIEDAKFTHAEEARSLLKKLQH